MTTEKIEWLRERLRAIAALNDHPANAHLAKTGSYSGFDEPGSVRIAREILSELKLTTSEDGRIGGSTGEGLR